MSGLACGICGAATCAETTAVFSEPTDPAWARERCAACGHAGRAVLPQFSAANPDDYYTRAAPVLSGRDVILRLAQRVAPSPARLLDVGAGNGQRLLRAAALGYDAQGFDVDQAAAQAAHTAGARVTVARTLDAAGLTTGSFDLITANHVAEHAPDPVAMLATIRALLAPGGHAIIAVPNAAGMPARVFGGAWTEHDPPRHLQFFTSKSFRLALRRAGFETVHLAGRAFVWPHAHARGIRRLRAEQRVPARRERVVAASALYPLMTAAGLVQEVRPSAAMLRLSTGLVAVAH